MTKLPKPRVFLTERWRYYLLHSLDQKLGKEAPFGKALLLNDRTDDYDWIQQLIQGGLLHLIAISGLHVLFFYYILITLMNLVFPHKVTEVVFLILILFYAGLCQWSAPVMRAIVMILLLMIAKWMQRPVSPLQIISLSLFIITLFDPVQLFSIGLQLSYACVIVLIYIVPKWHFNRVNIPMWKRTLVSTGKYLLDTVIISVLVSFVLLPLTLFYFQRGSLNGVIGNIIGVPLIGLLLPMTFLLLLFPAQWAVFQWLKASFDLLYYTFQKWVAWTAKLPFYVDTIGISLPWLIVAYLVIAAIVVRLKSGVKAKWVAYLLLVAAIPVAAYTQFPGHKPFTLTVFNVGLGDCTLVQYPQGHTLMIDTGPTGYRNQQATKSSWMQLKAISWLRHHNVSTIDLLVLSHLHDDHAGGVKDLFRNLNVRNLMISARETNTVEWQQLMQSGILKEAQIKIVADTLTFPFANSTLTVLNPGKDLPANNENDNSLVLRLDYKDFSALLAGDITANVEEHLIAENRAKLDCDFLKVPHHGSKYSSSSEFIRAVSPTQACITVPLHNRFHFPDKETMTRYRNYGIEPQLTGNGSVVVTIP